MSSKNIFALCEKGNHFYNINEFDRALYYYNMALLKGYDGLQIIQRAQRLKDQGVVPKPPINVGKARKLIRVRQEDWRQYVFIKANYPDRLLTSLNAITRCTLDPASFSVQEDKQQVTFLQEKKPAMIFHKKDDKILRVTFQYFTEMEKYYKTTVIDGQKIKMPAKRRKFHFFIVYDSFTDLLIQLRRIKLFDETYYEDHRQELFDAINGEYGNYAQTAIKLLPVEFLLWLESWSIINELGRKMPNTIEPTYLQEYIGDSLDYYLGLMNDPLYKIDYIFMIIVFLEKLYRKYPREHPEKYNFIYTDYKYLPCKKFSDIYKVFFEDTGREIITEPKLHEFTKSIRPFRANLYK